jgi:hypothetical protein
MARLHIHSFHFPSNFPDNISTVAPYISRTTTETFTKNRIVITRATRASGSAVINRNIGDPVHRAFIF